MKRANKLAQLSFEYAIVIVLVVTAIVGMKLYFQRSLQERYRQSANVFGQGEQYAKGRTQETNSGDPAVVGGGPVGGALSCSTVNKLVTDLKNLITDLRGQADGFDTQADGKNIDAQALQTDIDKLGTDLIDLQTRADDNEEAARVNREHVIPRLEQEEAAIQQELDRFPMMYPECRDNTPSEGRVGRLPESDCERLLKEIQDRLSNKQKELKNIKDATTKLEKDAIDFRQQAGQKNNERGNKLEEKINLENNARSLQAKAAGLRNTADEKEAQINQYKTDFPDCFPAGGEGGEGL